MRRKHEFGAWFFKGLIISSRRYERCNEKIIISSHVPYPFTLTKHAFLLSKWTRNIIDKNTF